MVLWPASITGFLLRVPSDLFFVMFQSVINKEDLYETDATQIELNTFTDPRYKNYPELIALGKRMIKEKEGKGFYSFQAQGTKNIVRKAAFWKTIHFFNNDWIVVAYKEAKQ